MRRLTTAVLSTAAVAMAACAPTPAGGGLNGPDRAPRACFTTSQVTNFRAGEEQTLYLRAGRTGVFELQSVGWCRDLNWANALVIMPEFGGGSRLCAGDPVQIAYAGGGSMPSGPCRARVTRQLTAAEVEALPGSSRP
jgi:hypothetical protein